MHPIWGLHGPAAARTPGNGQQTWYRSTGNYKNGPRWPSGQADCYGLRMFGFPCKMKERVVHPKSWNPQFESIGIGHQIQPAIGVGLRLQPIPESRSPPPVPLYTRTHTAISSINEPIDQAPCRRGGASPRSTLPPLSGPRKQRHRRRQGEFVVDLELGHQHRPSTVLPLSSGVQEGGFMDVELGLGQQQQRRTSTVEQPPPPPR